MVGYAVGEIIGTSTHNEIEDHNREQAVSCTPQSTNCYEVVTAWVHPRYIEIICTAKYVI